MKKKLFLICLLLLSFTTTVNADTGVFIKEYDITSKIPVKKGTNVKILEELEDRYKISLYNKEYEVKKEFILRNSISIKTSTGLITKKEFATTGYLTKDIALKFPDKETVVLKRGTKVPVYDYANGKFKLKDNNSNEYSVSEDSISFTKPEELNPEISSDVNIQRSQEILLMSSIKKIGLPYIWGGISPIYGFDCSGFTQYLYSQVGIRLPRTAKEQARLGTPVKANELMLGDLLFFGKNNRIDHVGMYVGKEKIIHSARKNNGVGIESIHSDYVKNNIMFAKRYLE